MSKIVDTKAEILQQFQEEFTEEEAAEIRKWESERTFKHSFGPTAVNHFLSQALDQLEQVVKDEQITGDTSDGYHTFNELYEFRKVYNAVLFNEWSNQGKYQVHKSKQHSDGEYCFGGGWFIVMATLPTGQISNHYELKDWDLFDCEVRELADVWDGHTPQDVVERLRSIASQEGKEENGS